MVECQTASCWCAPWLGVGDHSSLQAIPSCWWLLWDIVGQFHSAGSLAVCRSRWRLAGGGTGADRDSPFFRVGCRGVEQVSDGTVRNKSRLPVGVELSVDETKRLFGKQRTEQRT